MNMSRITNTVLAELRRLASSATAAPWRVDRSWPSGTPTVVAPPPKDGRDGYLEVLEFACSARNHLASLLDEVERLRAGLKEAVDAGHAIVWDSSSPTALDTLARLAKLADGTP
jgi:hypothetical protein